MNETNDIPLIEKSLNDVQAAVTAAHPPGEHASWLRDALATLDTLAYVTKGELLPRHDEEFERIVAEDVVLKPKVDQLREVDIQLARDLARLSREADRLAKNLEESDFKKESDHDVEQLVTRSVELVARFRQQRAAIQSLFMEAFQRDRGFSS